jgi:hypothetical protein
VATPDQGIAKMTRYNPEPCTKAVTVAALVESAPRSAFVGDLDDPWTMAEITGGIWPWS